MHAIGQRLAAYPCTGQCSERYPGPASPQRLQLLSRRCLSALKSFLRPRCCGLARTCHECATYSKLICCRYTATGRPRHHHAFIRQAQKQQSSSFDDMVQNSELPVLVDFYATWCGPCQIMSQVLSVSRDIVYSHHLLLQLLAPSVPDFAETPVFVQKLSAQMGDKIKIVKIDTDKYPKIASRYAIQVCSARLKMTSCQVLFDQNNVHNQQDPNFSILSAV